MFERENEEENKKKKASYYPQILVNFANKNPDYIEKLEKKIENMVKKGKPFLEI